VALDSGNVRVGVTGVVYVAPLGTTLPTSVSTTPNAAFKDLGYISDGGITQSISSDSTEIKAWQNATTVRTLQTGHTVTYQMEFLEVNWLTLYTYVGNFSAGVSELTADQLARKSWIIHVDDGTDDFRIVIPEGQITERGDTAIVSGDAFKLPVTVTAYPDDNGVKAYIYTSIAGS
jgi:hypothetical protein